MRGIRAPSEILVVAMLISTAARAESNSPYIDELRSQLPSKESGSFTESEQKRLKERDAENPTHDEGSLIERVQQELRERDGAPKSSYTEEQKAKLEPKESGGAIAAVREGRSELQMKREGEIHNAGGFRTGVGLAREVLGSSDFIARDFSSVYGENYTPNVEVFWEFQPFHSEWFGNIGFEFSAGFTGSRGTGVFRTDLPRPDNSGASFGTASRTKFTFVTFPVSASAIYRFNLLRIIRPHVSVGPSVVAFFERRSDGASDKQFKGRSFGFLVTGGASLLLDIFSSGGAWDLYATYGIKHTYLTLEYQKLTPTSGDVQVSYSGITAGFTFEY